MKAQQAPLMDTYRRWPVRFVGGHGATLVADDGRTYLDLVGGIAVASVGHAHPRIAEAISDQAGRLIHVSNLYRTTQQEELAVRLAGLTAGMRSFFCNSGTEAVECALKLARKRGRELGRWRIVTAEGSFHGRTFGALSATGQPSKRAAFEPVVPGFTHVPYGDLHALASAVTDDVAAVLLEPVQGEAGVLLPPNGYLSGAREICDRTGTLLILDEVQTGLGRTGTWFAYQHEAAQPDILCLGKALAGGLPMGACLAVPAVADAFEPGDHGSTFGGGPVQCAAALAVLDVIDEEDLLERARVAGNRLVSTLAPIDGVAVRGRGLLIGIALGRPTARAVAQDSLDRLVLVNDATADVIRLVPPLVISDDEIALGASVLKEVLDAERAA